MISVAGAIVLLGIAACAPLELATARPFASVAEDHAAPANPARASIPLQLALPAALPVALGFAADPGLVSVAGRELTASIETASGVVYQLPGDFEPAATASFSLGLEDDPHLGPARELIGEYRTADRAAVARVQVTAARDTPSLLYHVRLTSGQLPQRFTISDLPGPGLDLKGDVELHTLYSAGYARLSVTLGEEPFAMRLHQGAPLLLWSEEAGQGYVLAFVDESAGPSVLHISYDEDGGLRTAADVGPSANDPRSAPRLYFQRVQTADLGPALASYRALLDAMAPAPPIPSNFRQQWGTWYLYGGEIDEHLLRAQIDAIADRYGDLGPWQVVIDAGWYLAGDHPDGEMGVVDAERFPSGMRALVDYAHQRGIEVVLYASAPWIDSRPTLEDWWVVQLGFVRDHPDWLIPVERHPDGTTYVYDMSNPGLRAYLRDVIRRYFVDFNADGILLDMVGLIGDYTPPLEADPLAVDLAARYHDISQTMEVYRFFWETANSFKPNAWIEAAWGAPSLARSYAHTWRYGDDGPLFSHPYPYGGLLEHISFAAAQEQILGRRSHLGFIWGGPDSIDIQRQWLAAAVAMQRQTILNTDLVNLDAQTTAMNREYLAALRPFSANPRFGPGIPPETFWSTVQGTTYLGVLNPASSSQSLRINLRDLGLPETGRVVAFNPENRQSFLASGSLDVRRPAESLQLLVMRSQPGVLWGDRAWTARQQERLLEIDVAEGRGDRGGQLWVYAPGTPRVSIDGQPALAVPAGADGVLRIDLPDSSAKRIRIEL